MSNEIKGPLNIDEYSGYRSDGLIPDNEINYQITNSVLFDGSTGYLERIFGTPTSTTTQTISFWIKRSGLTSDQAIFSATVNSQNYLHSGDSLRLADAGSMFTNHLLRDTTGWMHICVVYDTSNGTVSDRSTLYFDGVEVTDFSTETNPSASEALVWLSAVTHNIGRTQHTASQYLDGYISEFISIDGQALTPSDFGTWDHTDWKPKKYTGTYGSNGFLLEFKTVSNLGLDTSGNNNHWNTNGAIQQTYDSPTDNIATLNTLSFVPLGASTLSEGNLRMTQGASWRGHLSTIGGTGQGKWGYQFTTNSNMSGSIDMGVGLQGDTTDWQGSYQGNLTSVVIRGNDGAVMVNNATLYNPSVTPVIGDVFEILWDEDSGDLIVNKNGEGYYSEFGVMTTGVGYLPYGSVYSSSITFDFGQNGYEPSINDYKTLTTKNISGTGQIDDISAHMETLLYAGTGVAQSIVGTDWKEGDGSDSAQLLILKDRDAIHDTIHFNNILGPLTELSSSTTSEASTKLDTVQAFNSNGFDLGVDATGQNVNFNGSNFVAWRFNLGKQTDKTELLAHFDGTDAQTTYTSEDWQQQTGTFVGTAQLDTAQKKFGTSSALFDGNSDEVTFPSSVTYDMGLKDFTIEAWVRFADNTGLQGLVSKSTPTTNRSWDWVLNSGLMRFRVSSDGTNTTTTVSETWNPAQDTWIHICAERHDGNIHLYADGVELGTGTADTTDIYTGTAPLRIGHVDSNYLNGWMDDVRVTVCKAVYGGAFTPPTEAHQEPEFNTDGSVNTRVSINKTLGMSIIEFIGSGATDTFGHDGDTVPFMFSGKERSGTGNWQTYHEAAFDTGALYLNSTAIAAGGTTWLDGNRPTNKVITIYSGASDVNTAGQMIIMYVWFETPYCKPLDYTGNGAGDGTYVHVDHEPIWTMIKPYSGGTGNWGVIDNVRSPDNPGNDIISMNLDAVENVDHTDALDILGNGLKMRSSGSYNNASSRPYCGVSIGQPNKLKRAK